MDVKKTEEYAREWSKGFVHGLQGVVSANICLHEIGSLARLCWMQGYAAGERDRKNAESSRLKK